jgi:NitT/TauT family transport system substrate-binding protein
MMSMAKTIRTRAVYGAVFATVMLALSAGAAPRTLAAETVRVGTPEAEAYIFALLDVGVSAGLFAKNGIDLQRIDFGGGGKLAQAMTAGSIDMALSGGTDLAFIAKGMPAKAVAAVEDAPVDMCIIAPPAVTRPEQLKAKTIGVTTAASLTAWLAHDFARMEGWGPDGVTVAPVGSVTSAIAALRTGNIDAFVGPLEAGYLLASQGGGGPLLTFAYDKTFITHMLFASDTFIAAHPATLRRFLQAWFDTVAFARAHREDTIRLSAPHTRLPADAAAKVYDAETPALSTDGRIGQKPLEAVVGSLLALHLVNERPTLSRLYTEEFLPRPESQ